MAILRTNPLDGTPGDAVSTTAEGAEVVAAGFVYAAGGWVGQCGRAPADVTAYIQNHLVCEYAASYVRLPALPTSETTIEVALASGGSPSIAAVAVTPAGAIRIYSGLSTLVATSTATITAGTWYGLHHRVTTTGQTLTLYDLATGDPLDTIAGAAQGSAVGMWRHGHPQGGKRQAVADFDVIRLADTPVSFTPPVAAGGGWQVGSIAM